MYNASHPKRMFTTNGPYLCGNVRKHNHGSDELKPKDRNIPLFVEHL